MWYAKMQRYTGESYLYLYLWSNLLLAVWSSSLEEPPPPKYLRDSSLTLYVLGDNSCLLVINILVML